MSTGCCSLKRTVIGCVRYRWWSGILALCVVAWCRPVLRSSSAYFGIQVVDEQTGRGVPLVELETVNHLRYVTDSGGWVAFYEPGLMGEPVFFFVRSHGYEYPKDGFGYAGRALTPQGGEEVVLKVRRRNIAERLYRVTGEGIYRDSVLLGKPVPLEQPLGAGKVAGQDSVFALPYRERLYWFWGDTGRMRYPLGHFWMAGAVSELPGRGGLDPALGVNLRYFTNADGFSRPVARLGVEKGLIWADEFLTVQDAEGRERLVCRYAHMESLERMLDHGLAVWDDQKEEFVRVKELDLRLRRLFPAQAHVFRDRDGGRDYFYFGEVFPTSRVRADYQSVLDPDLYEVWTCLEGADDETEVRVVRDAEGKVGYGWRQGGRPVDARVEESLVDSGKLRIEEARYLPLDVESGQPVLMHRGSVRWNGHRHRWILIATEQGGTSMLGEVWYSESESPTGPWRRARKVVTHDRYSFYNPVQHDVFDQEGGRIIYFEGTYANTFSGNADATPRYDYNQVLYRLDVDDPRLEGVRGTP